MGIFDQNINITGKRNTLILTIVFALWAVYRVTKRLALLRNGVFSKANITKSKSETYDIDSGITGSVILYDYQYKVDGESYKGTLWWTFLYKGKLPIEIVYNSLKPIIQMRLLYNK